MALMQLLDQPEATRCRRRSVHRGRRGEAEEEGCRPRRSAASKRVVTKKAEAPTPRRPRRRPRPRPSAAAKAKKVEDAVGEEEREENRQRQLGAEGRRAAEEEGGW